MFFLRLLGFKVSGVICFGGRFICVFIIYLGGRFICVVSICLEGGFFGWSRGFRLGGGVGDDGVVLLGVYFVRIKMVEVFVFGVLFLRIYVKEI